jgi:hypothetical protein
MQPGLDLHGRLVLSRPVQQDLTAPSRRKRLSLLAKASGLVSEPLLESFGLFVTTSLQHGIAPSFEWGGSATGVLITDRCQVPLR